MKANKLITSINSILNEFGYAKYNLQQIYDESGGHEEFINYIETISSKIIKNMNPKYGLDPKCSVIDDITTIVTWGYDSDIVDLRVVLMFTLNTFKFKVHTHCYDSKSNKFIPKETIIDTDKQNIYNELNTVINNNVAFVWKKVGLK